MVFDTRIGLYNDPPTEKAMTFIQSVDDAFKYMHNLMFGFVEKNLVPYINTPSFNKFSKAMDTGMEIGEMFVNKKIKELDEIANRGDSQENEGEVVLIIKIDEPAGRIQEILIGGV